MVRAVFFDVAHTLLYKDDLFNGISRVLASHGHTVDSAELEFRHKLVSEVYVFPDKTSKEFYTKFNSDFLMALGILPNPVIVEDIFNASSYLSWKAFDDTVILKDITHPLGIISNWDGTLREKLKVFFDVEFTWVSGSFDKGIRKPDVNFYKQTVEETGLNASEILYVGDSIRLDIQPALSIGMKALLVDRQGIYPDAGIERISTLSEIIRYL
jgi:FMN phosphatase YigB (HAD superfamily)